MKACQNYKVIRHPKKSRYVNKEKKTNSEHIANDNKHSERTVKSLLRVFLVSSTEKDNINIHCRSSAVTASPTCTVSVRILGEINLLLCWLQLVVITKSNFSVFDSENSNTQLIIATTGKANWGKRNSR